jgi:hypothetical protein
MRTMSRLIALFAAGVVVFVKLDRPKAA